MLSILLACRSQTPPPADSEETTSPATGSDPTEPEPTSPTTPAPTAEIWRPAPGTSWQWQLTGAVDTSYDVDVYDIDLFEAPQQTIDGLHSEGRKVICYFSAGSQEDWRPDADDFPPQDVGEPLDGWPGERWVDPRSEAVRAIMQARLDLAVERSCDAVEPDNVEAWAADSGFDDLTRADQLDYNRFLAAEAHARGLSVGLKNVVELADDLVDDFDWTLNEECLAYDECSALSVFLDQQKAVFHVEYVDRPAQADEAAEAVCGDPTLEGFSTLIMTWDLDGFRLACP